MDFILTFAVDFILLVILVTSVLSSMHKGFFKSILSLVAFAVAFFVASFANEPAAEWCYDNLISDSVVEKLDEAIPEGADNIELNTEIVSFVDSLPSFVGNQLEKMDIDIEESLEDISNKQISSDEIAKEISTELIRPGMLKLLRLVCFMLIFLLLRLLLGIVVTIVSKIATLPILRQINKGLGALIGLIKGVLGVFSLAVVLNFISELLNSSNEIGQAIENSLICDIIIECSKII